MKTMQPWWQQPFFQVALPIMVMFALTYWAHNRRIDDLNKRIDDLKESLSKRLDAIERRLERIEHLLADHDRRITALEERTSPLRR
jgi:tetrahydromethanopterin S-methyltransferase subunit G